MTQSALAAKAGVDRAELNRLVNDRRQPRLEELGWLAEALDVGVEKIVGDLELPADLRSALAHFGGIARRVLRAEGERDQARAQIAALRAESTQERQERRRERNVLVGKSRRLAHEIRQLRTQLARERRQRRSAAREAEELLSTREVLAQEVRKLRELATTPSKSAGDAAATLLTMGVLGKSLMPAGRN